MLTSSYFLFIWKHNGKYCLHSVANFVDFIYPLIELILIIILPLLVMVVCNGVIVYRVVHSSREIRSHRQGQNNDHSIKGLSSTVLALALLFAFLTVPFQVHKYYNINTGTRSEEAFISIVKISVIENVGYVLNNLNHAISFYLYLLTGKSFRQKFLSKIRNFC